MAHNTTGSDSSGSRVSVHTLISEQSPTGGTDGGSPATSCPAPISGTTASITTDSSINDIPGTTTEDLQNFADGYNAIRIANCLTPVPYANIRFSSCLEQRLFWMADDPSTNPVGAWGHTGTAKRSDGLQITGCDGDLAAGNGYTGATAAQAWWTSIQHRDSLYQPSVKGNMEHVCIEFALTHGGVNVPGPNEPYTLARVAAYWESC